MDSQIGIGDDVAHYRKFCSCGYMRRERGLYAVVDDPQIVAVITTDEAVERVLALVFGRTCVVVTPLVEVGIVPCFGRETIVGDLACNRLACSTLIGIVDAKALL